MAMLAGSSWTKRSKTFYEHIPLDAETIVADPNLDLRAA